MVTKGINSGVKSVFQAFPAENMHHYPRADLGIGTRNGLDIRQRIADFGQGDAAEDVDYRVLPGGYGGDEHSYGKQEGSDSPPQREFLLSPDSDKADPAGKTMQGREIVVGRVNGIEESVEVVPDRGSGEFGPDVCSCRESDVADQKDYLCQMHRAEESFALLPVVLQCDRSIADGPDDVGADVDDQGPRDEPERMVDRKGHVPVMHVSGYEPGSLVDQLVCEDCQKHRHEYIWKLFSVQLAHQLNFNKKGRL